MNHVKHHHMCTIFLMKQLHHMKSMHIDKCKCMYMLAYIHMHINTKHTHTQLAKAQAHTYWVSFLFYVLPLLLAQRVIKLSDTKNESLSLVKILVSAQWHMTSLDYHTRWNKWQCENKTYTLWHRFCEWVKKELGKQKNLTCS